jgi:nucleotide-binding universal stress UspA family protein
MDRSLPFRHIVCATDFSACSRAALRTAAELARRFGATLTLAHVVELPLLANPEAGPIASLRASACELVEDGLAEWKLAAEDIAGRPVATVMLEGTPWDRITRLAADGHTDLVVVGTHGRTGIQHALVGSVAERIVRHAPCPVLVVREVKP